MHVPMEMLKAQADFRMTHIPFTGAGPAVIALLGGQVDAIASGPATVVQQINAGKLRALAHWGDRPLAALPGVPSLKELGYAAQFAQWSALFVPAGTPDEIVQKLRAAAQKIAADPVVQQTITRAGSPVDYLDAPAFQTYWDGCRGDDRGGAADRQGRIARRGDPKARRTRSRGRSRGTECAYIAVTPRRLNIVRCAAPQLLTGVPHEPVAEWPDRRCEARVPDLPAGRAGARASSPRRCAAHGATPRTIRPIPAGVGGVILDDTLETSYRLGIEIVPTLIGRGRPRGGAHLRLAPRRMAAHHRPSRPRRRPARAASGLRLEDASSPASPKT